MNVSTLFNNFSRGKIDHDLNSRFDLSTYANGADVFKNFYSNFKGNAIFRGGFEKIVPFEDCAFLRFRFSSTQDYLCLLYNTKMKFLTYDTNGNIGFVQSGGSDLVVTTPWTLAQSKELCAKGTAQAGDLMFMCHPSTAPYLLTRVSATSFTLATYTRTADPFTATNKYPSACAIFEGALYYANTNEKRTTIWRSKIGDFYDNTIGTDADDGFSVAVDGLTEGILWLRAGANCLLAGSSQGVIPITGGNVGTAITPTNVTTKISDADGSDDTVPIQKDNLIFYINGTGRNLNYFSYDIIQETFQSKDANIGAYDVTAGKLKKLVYKKDKNNLIWSVRNGKNLVSLNFNLAESIIGWHEHKSTADILDISAMNSNLGDTGFFALLKYGTAYYVCRMAEEVDFPLRNEFYTGSANEAADTLAFYRYTAERMKLANHLDISTVVSNESAVSITYTGTTAVGDLGVVVAASNSFAIGDVGNRISYKTATGREYGLFEIVGYTDAKTVNVKVLQTPHATTYASWYKTFSTISGITEFAGMSVRLVADGGDFGDVAVSAGGELTIGREVTVAVVGLPYEGLIKTFDLGFQSNGVNTQVTKKTIGRTYCRFVSSAGGEIGSTLYRMAEIQDFNPAGFFDLPPLPMDGTSRPIAYSDNPDIEKCLYIRQTKALPLKITGIMAEVKYVA